jgi:uncharacterized phage protein (TIGR01671 family)
MEKKFRAYDTDTKKYLWTNFREYMNERHQDKPIPERIGWIILNSQLLGLGHRVIFEQFTGIIDDNKKEIYEGDIVNYVTGNPGRYVNCVVRFGEYETYTKIIVVNDTDQNDDAGEVDKHIGFYLEDGDKKIPIGSVWIQKIGNIYQNPELLQSL